MKSKRTTPAKEDGQLLKTAVQLSMERRVEEHGFPESWAESMALLKKITLNKSQIELLPHRDKIKALKRHIFESQQGSKIVHPEANDQARQRAIKPITGALAKLHFSGLRCS